MLSGALKIMKNKTYKKNIIWLIIVVAFLFFNTISLSFALELPNPLGTGDADKDPRIFIGRLIKGILGLSGSVALLMFVYGGTVYLTAQGENEKIQRAKNTIVWATVGLVVIFGSYAFLTYLFKAL